MKFMQKTKGAISVFMVCILLPVMVLGSLLIDQARIKLAGARVAQATDITLNTALSLYDNILKEVYGIFATSQSEKEMFNKLEDYYSRNLMIAGFDEETSSYLTSNIIDYLGGMFTEETEINNYSDFLSVQLDNFTTNLQFDDASSKKNNTKDSLTLVNPGMMREQIVDFMKFRAPLGIGLDLIDLIKSFNTVEDQAKVVENKTSYYEAESDLEKHLCNAWASLEKYRDLTTLGKATLPESYNKTNNKNIGKFYSLKHSNIETFANIINDVEGATGGYRTLHDMFYNDIIKALIYEQLIAQPVSFDKYPDEFKDLFYINYARIPYSLMQEKDSETREYIEKYTVIYNPLEEAFKKILYSDEPNAVTLSYAAYYYSQAQQNLNVDFTKSQISDEDYENLTDQEKANRENSYRNALRAYNGYNFSGLDKAETERNQSNAWNLFDQAFGTITHKYNKSVDAISNILISGNPNSDAYNQIALVAYVMGDRGTNKWYVDYYRYVYSVQNLLNAYYALPSYKTDEFNIDNAKYIFDLYFERVKGIIDACNRLVPDTQGGTISYARTMENSNRAWTDIYDTIYPYFKGISCALDDGYKLLQSAETELNTALNLYDNELKTRREKWKSSSENEKLAGSNFSENNLEEIEVAKGKYSRDDIVELKDHITTKKNTIDGYRNAIKEYKFNGFELAEITDLWDYEIDYEIYVESKFGNDFYIPYAMSEFPDYSYLSVNGVEECLSIDSKAHSNKFVVHRIDSKEDLEFGTNPPKLYKYMSKMYNGASKMKSNGGSESSTESKNEDSAKTNFKENSKSLKNSPIQAPAGANKGYKKAIEENSTDIGTDFPSKAGDGTGLTLTASGVGAEGDDSDWDKTSQSAKNAVGGIGDAAKGVFGKILDAIKNSLEEVRNYIYIEEYIMGMFSYKTMEKEVYYDLCGDKIPTTLADKILYSKVHFFDNNEEKLQILGLSDEQKTNVGNPSVEDAIIRMQTLTNCPINPVNNVAYLNEVEYIVFGEGGSGSVDLTIKGIRFILNTIGAFTNNELTTIARTIAMACFGYPPLTFLVPIAQVIILIALAIGETALDMVLINGGFSVPVFKSEDTWMLSPKGLVKETGRIIAAEAKEYVNEKASEFTNWMNEKINNAADDIANWSEAKLSEAKTELEGKLNAAYDERVGEYITEATDTLSTMCDTYLRKAVYDGDQYNAESGSMPTIDYNSIATDIINHMSEVMDLDSLDKNGIEYTIKKKTIEVINKNRDKTIIPLLKSYDQTVKNVEDKIDEIPQHIKNIVMGKTDDVLNKLENWGETQINNFKNTAVEKVTGAMKQGKDALVNEAGKFFDGLADKCTGTDETLSSDKGKTMSLGYSGYLRIFLLIALISNQEGVLLRTADLIQLNMRKRTGINDYALSKAYTIVSIETESYVKPLFFNFDAMDRILGRGKYSPDGSTPGFAISGLYKVKYKQNAGY